MRRLIAAMLTLGILLVGGSAGMTDVSATEPCALQTIASASQADGAAVNVSTRIGSSIGTESSVGTGSSVQVAQSGCAGCGPAGCCARRACGCEVGPGGCGSCVAR